TLGVLSSVHEVPSQRSARARVPLRPTAMQLFGLGHETSAMPLFGPRSSVSSHFAPFQAIATLSRMRVRALRKLPTAMHLLAVAQEMLSGPWFRLSKPCGNPTGPGSLMTFQDVPFQTPAMLLAR